MEDVGWKMEDGKSKTGDGEGIGSKREDG